MSLIFSMTNRTLFVQEVAGPEGIAVDWVSNVVYWADSKREQVEVVALQPPHHRRILYWQDLAHINAICVAPLNGLLFWSIGEKAARIEVASMSGSDENYSEKDSLVRRTLVSRNIVWPNGLTLDTEQCLVYWADASKDKPAIEAISFDGLNRRTILGSGLQHPFALSLYQGTLFWTDWETQLIHSCSIGRKHQSPNSNNISVLEDDPGSTDQSAPICLSRARAQCACPTGVTLKDAFTCNDGPSTYLLLARATGLYTVSLDTAQHWVLPLDPLGTYNATKKAATSIDYDPAEQEILWVDSEQNAAVRATRRNSSTGALTTRTVMTNVSSSPGFALDTRGRNFYWTDENRRCIFAASMDGSARMAIVWTYLERPRAIIVHASHSLLLWTDWGDEPKIERSDLDGGGRTAIVTEDIIWPNALAVDDSYLYWADGNTNKIECSRLDGSMRRTVLGEGAHRFSSLTLLHDVLYWVDSSQRSVGSVRVDGSNSHELLRNVAGIFDIKAVQREQALPTGEDRSTAGSSTGTSTSSSTSTGTSITSSSSTSAPCADNKAGCSHLCFHSATAPGGYTCRCPSNLELSSDGHTCLPRPPSGGAFLLYCGSKGGGVHRLSLSAPYRSQPLPLTPFSACGSVAYDPVSGTVYRTDPRSKLISRARLDGSDSVVVAKYGLMLPKAVAVDALNRNLYWIDMLLNRLEVSRLDGSSRRVLLWRHLHNPSSITIDAAGRALYWSELGSSSGVIKRSGLDGSDVREIITGLGNNVALTVSRAREPPSQLDVTRLYWSDAERGKIETSLTDGSDRRVL
ncbi:hypothetical protein HAZT_HAZT002386, partial [Hyalella azteca]